MPHEVRFLSLKVTREGLGADHPFPLLQWLLATSKARLRNFLTKGSQLAPFLHQLSNDAEDEDDGSLLEVTGPSDLELGNLPTETVSFTAVGPPVADPLADSKIPMYVPLDLYCRITTDFQPIPPSFHI